MSTNLAEAGKLRTVSAALHPLAGQIAAHAAPLFIQPSSDGDAARNAKNLQNLLLLELQHRLKNMLTMVMAITSQSLRTAETLEQGRIAVEQRLLALGRANDLLLQADWSRSTLFDVVRTAIGPFDNHAETRFFIQNSALAVSAEVILPLVLSLNELCTNAVKYGALSNDSGRVAIKWTTDDGVLRFSWSETGGGRGT